MDLDWDWTLFLAYLDVLAWPVVVLAVIVIFRSRLHDLMGRITQAEGVGFKAQFAHARAKVEGLELAHANDRDQESQGSPPIESPPREGEHAFARRKESVRVKALQFGDLVDAHRLLDAYDEVVIDLSNMESVITRMAAGMWGLGVAMGSANRIAVGDDDDDGKLLTLRHAA